MDPEDQVQVATILIRLGLRPQFVQTQTGLNQTKVSKMSKTLRATGTVPTHRGRVKTAHNLLAKRSSHIEAIKYLTLYLSYPSSQDKEVETDPFVNAYLYYRAVAASRPTGAVRELLDINSCMVIARGYRSAAITITSCSKCPDGILLNHNNKLFARCPVCSQYGVPRRNKQASKTRKRVVEPSQKHVINL